MEFIPDAIEVQNVTAPYFDDQRENENIRIPGYSVVKSHKYYKNEIITLLGKLGAGGVEFTLGTFPTIPPRYGFLITFNLNGVKGKIEAIALPIRKETRARKDRTLAQALYLIANMLQSEVYTVMIMPGSIPLVPYLIGNDGKTVTEALVESKQLPMLRAVSDG